MDTGNQDFNEINEEYLKQNDWWWRRLILGEFQADSTKAKPFQIVQSKISGFASQPSEWSYWEKKVKFPSFRYELARRFLCRDKYLPWPQLSDSKQSFLLSGLNNEDESVCMISESLLDNKNWSSPMLPWQWKLDVSDNSLIKRLMTFINDERRKKNIPMSFMKKKSKSGKSISSNTGNFNRGVSWRGIELLDIQFYKVRKFENNSETSALSKAKKDSKKWAIEVEKLLNAHDSFTVDHGESNTSNFVFKFLSENFKFKS